MKVWNDAIPPDMPAVNKMKAAERSDTMYQLHQALRFHRNVCQPTKSLDASFDPLDEAVKTATTMATQEKAESQMGTQVKLTAHQLSRKFLQNAFLPCLEAREICLFCGHECVDELNENKLVLEENLKREVTSTRSRLLNLWVAAFVLIPMPLKISRQSQVMSVI